MQDFIEVEGNIELQKKRQDETNERKNAVEAYVYGLRNQLSDQLATFVTEQEQATVSDKLNQTEVCTVQVDLGIPLRYSLSVPVNQQHNFFLTIIVLLVLP